MNPSQPKNQQADLDTAVPGPESRALRAREDAHVAPGLQGYAVMAGIVVEEGEGSAVTDVDGNTFLDFIGGIGVNALGHSPPDVRRRRCRSRSAQGRRSARSPRARASSCVERLAAHAARARRPPAAALLGRRRGGRERAPPRQVPHRQVRVRQLLGRLPRQDAWARCRSWARRSRTSSGPMVPGAHQVPYADCYRCPVGLAYPSCGIACAEVGAQARQDRRRRARSPRSSSSRCRARPATSSRPRSSCRRCASIADELGALLIADEMITGLGRTGQLLGRRPHRRAARHRHHRQGVRRRLPAVGPAHHRRDRRRPSPGRTRRARRRATAATRSARPPAPPRCASSTRRTWSRTRASSARRMLRELEAFVDRYPFVGFVAGAACSCAIELVKDKKTKEPLPRRVTERIFNECVRRGLLTMAYAPSFRIQPALTIDEATAQERRRDPARGLRPRASANGSGQRERAGRARRRRAAAAARLARHHGARARGLVRLRPRPVRARALPAPRRHPALPAGAPVRPAARSPRRRWSSRWSASGPPASSSAASASRTRRSSASTRWPASSSPGSPRRRPGARLSSAALAVPSVRPVKPWPARRAERLGRRRRRHARRRRRRRLGRGAGPGRPRARLAVADSRQAFIARDLSIRQPSGYRGSRGAPPRRARRPSECSRHRGCRQARHAAGYDSSARHEKAQPGPPRRITDRVTSSSAIPRPERGAA